MNKKVILSHSGKQHSYHVARSLFDLGYLEKFYTSSYIRSAWLQAKILERNNQYWSRRFQPGLPGSKVEANWRFEFKEILYSKLYGQGKKTLDAVYQRDVKFDRFMSRRMRSLDGNIFWGFQGSCHDSLIAAKRSGKITICELSTAHAPIAKQILGEEQKLHPEWADSFDNLEFPDAYYERLCREPELSDWVIGASSFTLRTLEQSGIAKSKLKYLPLAFDVEQIRFRERTDNTRRPLKLLYAGRITQRKGIIYLLEAMKSFRKTDVELHVIGHVQGSGAGLRAYTGLYIQHPPVSQSQLFDLYGGFDALVLPSVFEGFGLVIVEAMAAGLPVIATPNTIGPELIDHGSNGYLVPVRDPSAIVQSIGNLLGRTDEERNAMRVAARKKALEFSWTAYKDRLKTLMESI